jgi:hypothetical protein
MHLSSYNAQDVENVALFIFRLHDNYTSAKNRYCPDYIIIYVIRSYEMDWKMVVFSYVWMLQVPVNMSVFPDFISSCYVEVVLHLIFRYLLNAVT